MVNGAFMVLKGHRSIVNQVRFNPHSYMICSSGVEKVIKVSLYPDVPRRCCTESHSLWVCLCQLWSPYRQPDSLGDLEGLVEEKSRSLYTHEEYISLVLNSGSGLSHDYVSQSIQEDPRMMAFFDSLVRREIEGWSSDSDSDLSEAIMQLHARGRRAARGSPANVATATAGPGSAQQSDSDNSSSSSLAGADVSGGEAGPEEGVESRRRSRRQRRSSGFLDNEDSDSSEFWLDPMPRPRSPSPRDNSTLSSPTSSPSLPAGPSSSSTSTSSSSSEDEERRSQVRRRNVMRRRCIHVLSRAGERPESVQALFSAVDSCSYPSISVDDLSTSSSDEEQDSLRIKPGSGREDDTCLSPSQFVCLSPEMSPERQQDQDQGDRTERDRAQEKVPAVDGSDGGEACSSSGSPQSDDQTRHGCGVNGQHRTETPYVNQNLSSSSDTEGETAVTLEDTRLQRDKGLAQKRTRVASEEEEPNSEKKLKA